MSKIDHRTRRHRYHHTKFEKIRIFCGFIGLLLFLLLFCGMIRKFPKQLQNPQSYHPMESLQSLKSSQNHSNVRVYGTVMG